MIHIFPFSCACGCAAASENEVSLRHNTSTRIFTIRDYVWPMKALDPDYLAPKQFEMLKWVCLRFCLCRISFSLGSFLLLQGSYRSWKSWRVMEFMISISSRTRKSWNFSEGHRMSWRSNVLSENKKAKR